MGHNFLYILELFNGCGFSLRFSDLDNLGKLYHNFLTLAR